MAKIAPAHVRPDQTSVGVEATGNDGIGVHGDAGPNGGRRQP